MSQSFSLSKRDVSSLVRGLCISLVAVVLSFVATNVIPALETSALTPQAAAIVAIASNAINILQRFVRETYGP